MCANRSSAGNLHEQSRNFRKPWAARWVSPALAASLLLILAGIWSVTVPTVAEYRTAKGEQRTIQLADGSRLTLNTDTNVRTELSLIRRTVVLQKGEAFFTVSHEKHRPFDVSAGIGTIRDIGTQFIVRRQDEKVTVTVVEGMVEVRAGRGVSTSEVRQVLKSGEELVYGQRDGMSPVTSASLAASMAWLEGKVLFEARPLAQLIQEIGRYQDGEIRVLDPDIAQIQVSGVFGVHDREGFLNALESAVSVRVSRVNKDLAVLEANQTSNK